MIIIPGPRAHQAGTLVLIECFAKLCGGHPQFDAVRTLIDGAAALPETLPPEDMALKFDAYFARSESRAAWGVAINDRWEGEHFTARVAALAARWSLDLTPYHHLSARLGPRASGSFTAAFGFDTPAAPPRLKLYLQEDPWDAGLGTPAELAPLLAEVAPGCALPGWLAQEARIGVLTLELKAGGARGVKAYVGAADAEQAASGAPAGVQALAAQMTAASPLPGGWYYTTIRMAADGSHRYAINKIYNQVQLGFRDDGVELDAAWQDAGQLFESAGQARAFAGLRRELAALDGLRVVPTASALEDGGRSADLYCAAWRI